MVKFLINRFCGELHIRITGAEPERLLNRCVQAGITLRQPRRTALDEMTAVVSVADFRRLAKVHRRSRCRVHILRRLGAPFFADRMKRRPGLLFGLAVILCVLYALNTRIWIIKTEISGDLCADTLVAQVMEHGVVLGMKRSALDGDALKLAMRSQRADLTFFAANCDGCVLTIKAAEGRETPEVSDKASPRDVVAVKDGVIQRQTVRRGTEIHHNGDAVLKGERLVDARVEPNEEWGRAHLVTADAAVWAQTRCRFRLLLPRNIRTRGRIVSRKTRWALGVGRTRINFCKKQCQLGENCDRISLNRCVHLNEYLTLPVSLIEETVLCYEAEPRKLPRLEAEAYGLSAARHRAREQMGEGHIERTEHTLTVQDGRYVWEGTVWCTEQIGEAVEDGRTQQDLDSETEPQQKTNEESET